MQPGLPPPSLFPESKERLIPLIVAGPYAPPVHMVNLTDTQEITPYPWCTLMRSGARQAVARVSRK